MLNKTITITRKEIKSNEFTPMHQIIPVKKSGKFGIEHKKITKEDVKSAELRSIFSQSFYPPKVGTATILYKKSDRSYRNHDVIMSDTEYEKITNNYVMRISGGNVLIAGLGIGMILLPMLKKSSVKKIIVVEREKDIINLVYKHIKKFDTENKLELIHDDINNVEFKKGTKFDVIYFDIWNNVCGDNYSEMKNLRKKFRKYRAKDSVVDSWEEEKTKDLDRRDY